MKRKSPYDILVEKVGEAKAKQAMREMRAQVKSPGLANADAETKRRVSEAGVKAREQNVQPEKKLLQDEQV